MKLFNLNNVETLNPVISQCSFCVQTNKRRNLNFKETQFGLPT